jgi:hypothetical protein
MIEALCNPHNSYIPVITEIQGAVLLAGGLGFLGIGSIIKVHDYYTGRKEDLLLLTDDAAGFNTNLGQTLLKQGLKRLLPTTGALLAVYLLSSTIDYSS